ncbi:MAG: DUF4347 domain-containing protein [Leptolyngbyaceae cyanobacterium SL_7_1]|nr:DUF4347 domain-containing protein [Leptolyngbyaceae cyanobacterium SL_7_1]
MNYGSPAPISVEPLMCHPSIPAHFAYPTTLVVIDAAVQDAAVLEMGVGEGATVVRLTADRDGIVQLTGLLKQHPGIRQLHLIAHGAPGCLWLANQAITLETIEHYAAQFRSWSTVQLFLYSCNLAAEPMGRTWLDRLKQLTGAAIAASTQALGNVALGGTWRLDTVLGQVDPAVGFKAEAIATYPALLNNDYFILANGGFSQDWSNMTLITGNNDWSTVPSIEGYRGDNLTATPGTNPQTVLIPGSSPLNVEANATNPNTLSLGGVAEFELTNPTVALQGSTTADAPFC